MTIARLEDKIAQHATSHAAELSKEMDDDMIQMMADSEEKVLKENPEGSFLHMFWQQQKEAASRPSAGTQ